MPQGISCSLVTSEDPLCSCPWPGGDGFPLCSALLPSPAAKLSIADCCRCSQDISQDIPTLSPLLSLTHLCGRLRSQESERQAHPAKSPSRAHFLLPRRRVKASAPGPSHGRAAEVTTVPGSLQGGQNQIHPRRRLRGGNTFLREVCLCAEVCLCSYEYSGNAAIVSHKDEKLKGRSKAKPFHAQHHPLKQAMHLNMVSGLHILRSVFLLRAFLPHLYSTYFLRSNPGNGRSDEFTCLSHYLELVWGPYGENTLQ